MVMVKIYIFIFEFFPPGTPHLHHPNIMVLLNTGMIEADTGTWGHGDYSQSSPIKSSRNYAIPKYYIHERNHIRICQLWGDKGKPK